MRKKLHKQKIVGIVDPAIRDAVEVLQAVLGVGPQTTLQGIGRPVIQLTTGRNRVALTCNKSQFVNLVDFSLESSGTKDDGNATVGILAVSKSYYSLSGLRFANFSTRG